MSGVEGSENRKGTARQVRNIFLKKKSWKEPEETKKRWKKRTRTKIIQNVSEDRRKEPFFVIDGGIFKSSELKESWVNLSSATFFFDLFFFRFAAFFFFFFSLFFYLGQDDNNKAWRCCARRCMEVEIEDEVCGGEGGVCEK